MPEKINPLRTDVDLTPQESTETEQETTESFLVTRNTDGTTSLSVPEHSTATIARATAIVLELAEGIKQKMLAEVVANTVLERIQAVSKVMKAQAEDQKIIQQLRRGPGPS